MARKNDPYLPLFVSDWLTNMKLKECSPEAHGLMISFMCLAHKVDDYGKLLLKQKHKICRGKNDGKLQDFADGFADYFSKILPWSKDQILPPLLELISEGVLIVEGDFLVCKRMVKDGEISEKRSKAGEKGADVVNGKVPNEPKPRKKDKEFAAANQSANSDIVIDNEIGFENKSNSESSIISMGGMQGGGDIDYPANFWEEFLKRFQSAYGNYGFPWKTREVIEQLRYSVKNVMGKSAEIGNPMDYMEAASFLCDCAELAKQADMKARQDKRKAPHNWLADQNYMSNPLEAVKPIKKQSSIEAMDEAIRSVLTKHIQEQEANK